LDLRNRGKSLRDSNFNIDGGAYLQRIVNQARIHSAQETLPVVLVKSGDNYLDVKRCKPCGL